MSTNAAGADTAGTPSRPIALTMGDPSGVGMEITAKAWAAGDLPPFFLIADAAEVQGVPVRTISDPSQATAVFAGCAADAAPPLACDRDPRQTHA